MRTRFLVPHLLPLLALLASAARPALAQSREREVSERLSRTERLELRRLDALRAGTLNDLQRRSRPDVLKAEVEDLFGAATLSLSLRESEEAGVQTWLRGRLKDVPDLVWLGELREQVPVPVPLEHSRNLRNRGAAVTRLTVDGDTFPVHPFWPNGALPTLAPEEGLRGPLVDVKNGEWEELEGLEIRGAIALMNFKGGRNWNRLFDLGAKAVVVVEDDYVNRPTAERFFANTPIPMPRMFVDRETGAALRERASRRREAGEDVMVTAAPEAVLEGGNWYENRMARSLFAWLPPDPSQSIEIRPSDLLERVAASFGVEARDLMEENRMERPELAAGQRLDIPGRLEPYVVEERDLLKRIGRETGVPVEELLVTNPGLDPELPAGTVLTVPALDDPLVLQVRLEAVSALPDLPHGAQAAANIVAAVRMLEMAGDMSEGTRRRGLLVAFLEGDVHGGRASRRFLETFLLEEGRLAPALVATTDEVNEDTLYDNYLQVRAWIRERRELSDAAGDWFASDWLKNQLEEYRVRLAEARVEAITRRLNRGPDADVSDPRERQTRLENQITRVIELRGDTFENPDLSPAERAEAFLSRVDELLVSVGGVPALTRAGLLEQFERELEEERLVRALKEENRNTVENVLRTLYPEGRKMSLDDPLLGLRLDLSTGSPHLEVATFKDYRGLSPFNERILSTVVERFDRVLAFAGLEAGWREPWSFIGNDVQAVFPLQNVNPAPSYAEFWAQLGMGVVTLRAANDGRPLLDTPLDVPENLDYENLSRLVRTASLLLRVQLESAKDGSLAAALQERPFSRVLGLASQFNVRSGIDAKDPVPHTLVYNPSLHAANTANWENYNTAAYMGTRIGVKVFSRLNGRYAMPVESPDFNGGKTLHAYVPDPVSGLFSHVFDAGQIGTQKQSPDIGYIKGQDTYKTLVLYELYPFVVSAGVEPLTYSVPSTPADLPEIRDAVLNGAPRHVNVEHPKVHFLETELTGLILYMEPGRNLQIIDRRRDQIRGLLLGDLSASEGASLEGKGIPIGPREGDRNLNLPLAAVEIARCLQEVNERRLSVYGKFGIRDQGLTESLALSRAKLERMDRYLEGRQWQQAVGSAREAWGILIKGYPRMLKLGREAVLSVVILMALLAPTSVFLEKLLLSGKHILARLGGSVGIFVLGTVFLNFFHPAFKIAAQPFIVVIAFAMILMAVVVLGICYQRFEVLVRRARIEGGEAESEEISFVSTLNTAFSLGVSNLKKRPTRTLLTAFTVTVLTFSIVSFVSVKGKDTLFLREVPLDLSVGGVRLEADEIDEPGYDGALFREYSWADLSTDFINAVETEFGSRFRMARRMQYIEAAGGNNALREGVNQIEIRRGGDTAIVTAIMGFEPAETDFTGLHRAVSHGHWFRAASERRSEDRRHIILPDRVARELGITPDQLVDGDGDRLPDAELPEVVMMNHAWRVVGILDADRADRIRDVNAKSPAMVDYLRSAITPSTGSGRLETEEDLVHMRWEDLAVVPASARNLVGGAWSSLALKFPEGFDFPAFRDELARRMDRAMFANVDGNVYLLSARKESSVGGLAKVLVPIILCVLIVSNTMMGTVDERVGEVQMLGAIGLSPSQISFLLLSESTVFSCIGIIFGTFAGLAFSQVVGLFPESLGQLSFNFTSLASTFLAMGTGGIVLLATLLPARKAAALAAPSGMEKWELPEPEAEGEIHFELPFTLTRGNAFGMAAFFRRFLLNHVDSSSADFITKGAALDNTPRAEGEGLRIRSHMWLAPYDLDVAQDLRLDIEPTGNEGVYGVTIHLARTSGTEDAWIRTNYGFLNLVRKQFLLWRNLDTTLRKRYIREGTDELSEEAPA